MRADPWLASRSANDDLRLRDRITLQQIGLAVNKIPIANGVRSHRDALARGVRPAFLPAWAGIPPPVSFPSHPTTDSSHEMFLRGSAASRSRIARCWLTERGASARIVFGPTPPGGSHTG